MADLLCWQMVADPDFFRSVLDSLPGADPNDPQIQEVLRAMGQTREQKDEDKSEGEKK